MRVEGWGESGSGASRSPNPDWKLRRLRLAYIYPFEFHLKPLLIDALLPLLLERGRGRVLLKNCLAEHNIYLSWLESNLIMIAMELQSGQG